MPYCQAAIQFLPNPDGNIQLPDVKTIHFLVSSSSERDICLTKIDRLLELYHFDKSNHILGRNQNERGETSINIGSKSHDGLCFSNEFEFTLINIMEEIGWEWKNPNVTATATGKLMKNPKRNLTELKGKILYFHKN